MWFWWLLTVMRYHAVNIFFTGWIAGCGVFFFLFRQVFPVLNKMFVVYFGVLRWCSMMTQFVKPWLLVMPSLHDDSNSNVITMFFLFSRDSNTNQVVSAEWIWSLGSRRPRVIKDGTHMWHLLTGWWFGTHVFWLLILWLSIQLEISQPQMTNSYFSEGWLNHQPVEFTDTEILRTWDF